MKTKSKFFEIVWKHRYRYFIGMVILLIVDYLGLYIPQVIGEATDGLRTNSLDANGIFRLAFYMVLASAGMALGRFFWRRFIIGSAHSIQRILRNEMFAKLETLSQRYFNENKTGDIMAYFTNDLDSLEDALGWSVISAFDAIVLTGLCLYKMMTRVSMTLTLYTLIPLTCLGVYGYYISQAFEKSFYARQEAFGKLTDYVQEAITAERVIKAFVQEDKQLDEFAKTNDHNRQVNLKIARLRSTAWPLMEVFIGAAYVIAIIVGGYYCLINEITLGSFVAFSSYVGSLVWPMLAFGDAITMFSSAAAAIKRIDKVFNEKADIVDDENPDKMNTLEGEIVFDNVDFRYGKDLPLVLDNVDFKIEKGETFAIMGRTGAGKSTIVNLITRMFDVEKGCVRIDGHEIKKVPLKVLRENIAYVPQDNFLFSETLRENIKFGKLDATMDEIIEACKMADIHDNISEFPEKYETMVGERGVTLSGGQKQRSSIARALLKDAPVLIMDDSLSAVDTDTEDNIIKNLKGLRANKTTIMIAHRVSTVINADHILILDEGKVAEFGTYQQLMDLDGIFASMVRKQQLEKQLATLE